MTDTIQPTEEGRLTAQEVAATNDLGAAKSPKRSAAAQRAAEIIDTVRQRKHCRLSEVLKLRDDLTDDKLSVDQGKPALEAFVEGVSKKGYLANAVKTVTNRGADKKDAVVLNLLKAIETARSLGIETSSATAALAEQVSAEMKKKSGFHWSDKFYDALEYATKHEELREVSKEFMTGCMDYLIANDKEPPFFLCYKSGPSFGRDYEGEDFWSKDYIDHLASTTDWNTPEGYQVAATVCHLERRRWLPGGSAGRLLATSPSIRSAVEHLRDIFEDRSHTVLVSDTSLKGFQRFGETFFIPTANLKDSPGGHLLSLDAQSGEIDVLAKTEQYNPRVVALHDDRLYVLTENQKQNGVAHLKIFDPLSGEELGSKVLPRPLHHLPNRAPALHIDSRGKLIYPSTSHKSADKLARVEVSISASKKVGLVGDHTRVDTTEDTEGKVKNTGYKLKTIAAEGGEAFGLLVHEGKGLIKLIEYDTEDFSQKTVLDAPIPHQGEYYFDLGVLAVSSTHILFTSAQSITVLERNSKSAELLGSVPIGDVQDLKFREDGGLDLVVFESSFQGLGTEGRRRARAKGEAHLISLDRTEFEKVFIDPFKAQASGTSPSLSGQKICFTGKLEKFNRREAAEQAERHGAEATGTVTNDTTLVVTGSKTGAKLQKARELGIEIIDEDEFLSRLG